MVALSCVIDTLRAANDEIDQHYYRWTLIGDQTTSVASSSDITLQTIPNDQLEEFDTLIICGGDGSHLFNNRSALNWLAGAGRTGRKIGSISDGAYVAAAAGLFDRCRSTIHWKCQNAYRERFPQIDVRMSILEVEGNRFSCAGGTASLDLMLKFVSDDLGKGVAGRIADNYFHDVIRGDDCVQHMTSAFRFAIKDKRLSDALLCMEANLEEPIPITEVASIVGISHRQIHRIFERHLKVSPAQHYRAMRLVRAEGLLKQSSLSISEIANGCGFQSSSHLSKFFKAQYELTPARYRSSR